MLHETVPVPGTVPSGKFENKPDRGWDEARGDMILKLHKNRRFLYDTSALAIKKN
jgi:hypothetical protein